MNATPSSPDILTAAAAIAAGRSRSARWLRPLALVLIVAVAAVVAWSQPAVAQQTYTWSQGAGTGNANQVWDTNANWVGSPNPLTFNNQTDLIFDNTTVVNRANAIAIGADRTIRSLSIGADYVGSSTATFDIQTFSTINTVARNLTFSASSGNASITVAQSTSGAVQMRLGSSTGGFLILNSALDLAQNNTFYNASAFAFEGRLSGTGAINKTGLGVVRLLRGNSAWSGAMNINEGAVRISNDAENTMGTGTWTLGGGANNTSLIVSLSFQNRAYANTGGIVVAAGDGTRTISNYAPDAGLPTLSGNITLNKDAIFDVQLVTADTADRMTLAGQVTGTGGIVKTNTGILILNGSGNNYSGTTDIQAGKLYLAGNGRLGSGDVTIASGANLDFGTGTGQINVVANDISGEGQIFQNVASTDTRFTGNVTNTGGLTINTGIVRIGDGTTTGSYTGNATVASGATLAFARSNAYTHVGTISGDGGISKVDDGAATLTGNNSYTGGTSLFSGALVADNASALGTGDITFSNLGGNTGSIRYTANSAATDWTTRFVNSPGTIRLDTNGNDVTLAGVIASTNTGGLAKSGTGTLTLGGANAYSGATNVDAGGLIINGSQASTSLTGVASAAWIGGTGSLTGGLTIASGGLFAFNPLDPTLDVSGAVSLDNSFGVASLVNPDGSSINWSSVSDSTYSLIGTTTSTFDSITNFGSGAAASIGVGRSAYFANGTGGGLELVVVPEPSTVALLGGLAATGVLLARRRLARG